MSNARLIVRSAMETTTRVGQREASLGRGGTQPEGGEEERVALDGVVAQRAGIHRDELVLTGVLPPAQRGAGRRVRVCMCACSNVRTRG